MLYFQSEGKKILSQKKILVVDDDELLLEIVKTMLDVPEYDVSTCSKPLVAIEKIKSRNFNIVITDYNMPLKNGLEFTKEVKSINEDIPILVMSGNDFNPSEHGVILNALCFHSDEIIGKPFNKEQLLSVVEDLLESSTII